MNIYDPALSPSLSPSLSFPISRKRKREILKPKDNSSPTVCLTNTIEELIKVTSPTKKRKFALDKVGSLRREIKTHFKTKMALIAQTLSVTANTKYHFEQGYTDAQGPSSHPTYIHVDGGNHKLIMNATHSSSIPVLYAYDRQEWEAYEQGLAPKPEGRIYLKYSGYYFCQNATIDLPFANSVDILLEGRRDEDKFRAQFLDIINAAAKGDLSFSEAIKQAYLVYEAITDEVLKEKFSEEDLDNRQEINRKVLLILKKNVQRDSEMLGNYLYEDRILGLPPTDRFSEEGRVKLYQARCDLIRRRYKLESKLNRDFVEIKKSAIGGCRRRPHGLERKLRMMVMLRAPLEVRAQLGKHFSTSLDELMTHKDLAQAQKFLTNKVLDVQIDQFLKDFEDGIKIREKIYQKYFGQVLNALMGEFGFDSHKLLLMYSRLFHSDLEKDLFEGILQGKEKADLLMTKRFARVLRVSPDFFFPDNFAGSVSPARKRLFSQTLNE